MKDQFVYDPLISKRQQYLLATQVCVPPTSEPFHLLNQRLCFKLVRAVLKIGGFHFAHCFGSYRDSLPDDVIIAGQAED